MNFTAQYLFYPVKEIDPLSHARHLVLVSRLDISTVGMFRKLFATTEIIFHHLVSTSWHTKRDTYSVCVFKLSLLQHLYIIYIYIRRTKRKYTKRVVNLRLIGLLLYDSNFVSLNDCMYSNGYKYSKYKTPQSSTKD